MSSLALMRWLEATPDRYDAGMRWITLGRVGHVHAALVEAAVAGRGASVLEIGCGTGAVTAALVAHGARVTAVDQNPEMLERARARLAGQSVQPGQSVFSGGGGAVSWLERTASEIDGAGTGFDAVVASLCLSEMSAGERAFVLRAARAALCDGGVLAVADEVVPARPLERALFTLLRLPQALLGWLLAGSLSRPIPALADEIRAAGFAVEREQRWLMGSLAVVVARPIAATSTDPGTA